eukprot:CAMPEP_0180133104 /NCGR_PEP_ID=MMETSP0986-20121125/9353_1 /TAXON_ID=697907 /ORGANISM="non described non described, Strain CCMP2293" /LENGTH=133 /DNA_ID=CAMNT_0022073181 /DNA_START=25 /DNA_END=426 /DNA_ORIENTATION=+
MKVAALAFIGSAAAFSPVMQMSTGRRVAIQGAGAAAIAAPLLRPDGAEAALSSLGEASPKAQARGKGGKILIQNNNAPYITIFDARGGCSAVQDQYKGAKSNSDDDKMCVKVQMSKVVAGNADAILLGILGQI